MQVKGYEIKSFANLQNANLQGADLQDANLQDAHLHGANLLDADLQNANLLDADLRGADLLDADLRGADLRGANLRGANLRNANLRHADLRNANFLVANLHNANLRDTDLYGVHLHGAFLAKTCLDPENKPNGNIESFERSECGSYVVGYRTREAGHIDKYRDGCTYNADFFSTCETTDCHPGLYVWPTLKLAQNWARYGEIIVVHILPEDIHKTPTKWRCRQFYVLKTNKDNP